MKATIQLLDEANAKIHNLSPATRRKLKKEFSYLIPHARHVPAFKLGRWDGMKEFFNFGGKTYVNLLPDILPMLIDEGYEVDLQDDRISYDINLTSIEADHFKDKTWPKGHPVEGQPVVLRDYQVEIINNFLNNTASCQEVATGAGKTLITAALSNLAETALDPDQLLQHELTTGSNKARTLVIVPNKGLVSQTEEDFINLGLDVGVYYGDRKEYGKTHTICTWQSLEVIRKNHKAGNPLSLEEFAAGVTGIIVDECFHEDTLILTPDGLKKISELTEGDTVINLDEANKQYKEDTVVKIHKNLKKSSTEEMLELSFDNGKVIRATANHKFLTDKGWVRADELTAEMDIIDVNTYN